MKRMDMRLQLALLTIGLAAHRPLLAQNTITALPYNSALTNFDTYNPSSAANAAATLPAGWSFSCSGTPSYNGQVVLAPATGGYYAYAALFSSDYNLGAQRDATAGNITYRVDYTNNTGGLITTLVLSWNYEQWRFANTSGWTCAGTGALAGNAVLATKGYTGASSSFLNLPTSTAVNAFTLSGLSIANGSTFGLAWTTSDAAGADNGVAIDDYSMSASSVASIVLASGTLAAGTVYQTSLNNPIYRADVTVGVTPSTLTAASFTTAGTYAATDLANLKLWYSSTPVFSTGATLLATRNTLLGAGAKTFTGLSQVLPLGTAYFFLTADLACSSNGNNLFVQPISLNSFTFSNGVKSGSGFTAGGTQTIAPLSLTAVASQSACSGKTMAALVFTTLPPGATVNWTNSNSAIGLASAGSGSIPAFTTATVATNTSANLSATVSNGSCTGTAVGVALLVKSIGQASSVWTGSVSGAWEDSNNWTNCACTGVTNATVPAVVLPAAQPTLNATAEVNGLRVQSGATLTASSLQTLTVRGDWQNNGTFQPLDGTVLLAGSVQQTVGGSSATHFYNLTLSNSSGAHLVSPARVAGKLLLQNGTLNTGNTLTVSPGGRIGPISATADLLNHVTLEQLAPGGSTGWALLGTSLATGHTLGNWNDDFPITCAACPDGYNNFTSVYAYNETAPGSYDAPAKYTPLSSINAAVANGVGYWVYLGNAYPATSDIVFDVTGAVAKSSCLSCSAAVTLSVSATANNGVADDGWNLLANPLPSPISWTALRNANANVDNAVYVFNADLNGGAGAHASYVNGVSSHPSGGIGDDIAMHQGFYVHATANTQLVAGENVKVDAAPAFLRASQASRPLFRVAMNDSLGFEDFTTFYFEAGGSSLFQSDFDAYKLNFDAATVPYLASVAGNQLLSINGLPTLDSNFTIPLKAVTPVQRSFVFSAQHTNFPAYVCVNLLDTYTGISTNLLNSTYACELYDSTSTARFLLSFYTATASGLYSVTQPTCATPQGGQIVAQGAGGGPWHYTWYTNSAEVRSAPNKAGPDTLSALAGGTYLLHVHTVGQCDLFSATVQVDPCSVPTASFLSAAQAEVGQPVSFFNQSLNAVQSAWNFGDGSGSSQQEQPSYTYSATGIYTVSLVAVSSSSCTDTFTQNLEVRGGATSQVSSAPAAGCKLVSTGPGSYNLLLFFQGPTNVRLTLADAGARPIYTTQLVAVGQTQQALDLSELPTGMYLLYIEPEGSYAHTFKLVR